MPFTTTQERAILNAIFGGGTLTATPTELSLLTGVTAGTAKASRALALGATKNIDTLLFDVAAPAAAGSIISDATAMTADYNFVTGANDAKGVKLPVAVVGRRIVVVNTVVNKILKVWPVASSTINALSASAAYSMPAGSIAVFYASSTTQWYGTMAVETTLAHVADLGTTVAKVDVDDAGTIDGTEIAAYLQAIHLKINAILTVLESVGMTALS